MLAHNAKTGRAHRIAFAALMLSVAAVFWQHLFTSDVLFLRDLSSLHYPRAVELRALVRAGLLPLWNPFEHFGEPVVVNPSYLLFYPTAWLAWVLPPAYGFKLHCILHFFVLAAGSFLLARRVGLKPFACWLAGALFAFSGPVMSLGNFYTLPPAAAWMPLAVLAADFQMRRGGWKGAGLFAASLTLQLFAGEPLTSIATVGLALGWSIALYGDLGARFWAGANRLVFSRFLFGLALAGGLAAVQLFPALWHLRHTERAAHLTYQHSFFWSLHPLRFVEMLIPEFWGNYLAEAGLLWLHLEEREPYLLSVFVGIVPLALALVAALAYRATPEGTAPHQHRATRFWLVAAVVAVVLALGRFTPVSYVFYDLVPVFRIVRFPEKFLIPAALAVSQLAALGMEYLWSAQSEGTQAQRLRWLSRGLLGFGLAWLVLSAFLFLWPEPARRLAARLTALEFNHARVLQISPSPAKDRAELLARAGDWVVRTIPERAPYVLGAALLWAGLLGRGLRESLRRRLVVGMAAAAILPLVVVHYTLNPVANRRYLDTIPAAARYLEPPRPAARIFAEPVLNPPYLPPASITPDLAQVDFLPPAAQVLYPYRLSLQAGAGLLGVENSFTADVEHVLPLPQRLLNNIVEQHGLSGEPLARLLRLGSVSYAFLKRLPPAPGLAPVGSASNATTLPVAVYRVRDPLPRAYLAPQAVVLPAGMPTIQRILSPEFDPARQVVLEEARWPPAGAQEFAGEAKLLRRDALHVEVTATTSVPAYLVLTDSFHPDWKVTVNGTPAPLLRANQIFRAVALPAGTHHVVFRYRPAALLWGAALTLATAIAIALLVRRERASGRAEDRQPAPPVA